MPEHASLCSYLQLLNSGDEEKEREEERSLPSRSHLLSLSVCLIVSCGGFSIRDSNAQREREREEERASAALMERKGVQRQQRTLHSLFLLSLSLSLCLHLRCSSVSDSVVLNGRCAISFTHTHTHTHAHTLHRDAPWICLCFLFPPFLAVCLRRSLSPLSRAPIALRCAAVLSKAAPSASACVATVRSLPRAPLRLFIFRFMPLDSHPLSLSLSCALFFINSSLTVALTAIEMLQLSLSLSLSLPLSLPLSLGPFAHPTLLTPRRTRTTMRGPATTWTSPSRAWTGCLASTSGEGGEGAVGPRLAPSAVPGSLLVARLTAQPPRPPTAATATASLPSPTPHSSRWPSTGLVLPLCVQPCAKRPRDPLSQQRPMTTAPSSSKGKPKKMSLSEIYDWIQEHYPYFKTAGVGWKVCFIVLRGSSSTALLRNLLRKRPLTLRVPTELHPPQPLAEQNVQKVAPRPQRHGQGACLASLFPCVSRFPGCVLKRSAHCRPASRATPRPGLLLDGGRGL